MVVDHVTRDPLDPFQVLAIEVGRTRRLDLRVHDRILLWSPPLGRGLLDMADPPLDAFDALRPIPLGVGFKCLRTV